MMMRPLRFLWHAPRRLLILAVLIVLAIETVLCAQSAMIQGFASSDAGVKLWQVQAILHTSQLDAPIDYPGAVYDPQHLYSPFVAPWFFWQNNLPYSEYTSPFIWASVPLYQLWGHGGLLVLPWLCGALLVILSAWLAWRVRPDRWAVLVPIVAGFSSPLLVYAREFWEHTPGSFLAVLAMVGIVKAATGSRRVPWLLMAGAAIGLGLTMRAELYVFPVAILIGLWFVRAQLPFFRSLLMLAIGGLLIAGPWWTYQFIRWGSPFGPRVAQNVPLLGGADMLAKLGDSTGRNWSMLWPYAGSGLDVLGILGLAALALWLTSQVVQRLWKTERSARILNSMLWILAVVLLAIVAVTTWRVMNWQNVIDQRPDDLLTTFPIVLALFLPVLQFRIQNSEFRIQNSEITRFLLVTSIAFTLLVIVVSPFQGGVQWGPRFLLPIIVPLSVVVVVGFAQLWQSAGGSRTRIGLAVILVALLLAGGYSTWTGARFMLNSQLENMQLADLIKQLPDKVVVTDAWFIPQAAPYTFGDKIWLLAEDKKSMLQLIQQLRKTTDEPSMIYISSVIWAHIDPLVLMGPRLALEGEPQYVGALKVGRYLLLK
jgi:4-amino-4-deoxy-L-arabinose transferase-like glycosyltransferase